MMIAIPTGDKLISHVLSGGYNVQPVPLDPTSMLLANINEVYDSGIIKTEILLTLGYVTSDAPRTSGTKTLPNDPINAGITKKKIISNPCKVIVML
jgi:hypothetical protein